MLTLRWLIAATLLFQLAPAEANDIERRLEAVFLGRFASYIEWPDNPRSHFIITLIDENPFGTLLDELYQNKRLHGKPIQVKYATKVEQIGESDILFITLDTLAARQAAIDHAQRHGILTISEAKGFAERGGIIQLNFVEQKTRIKINHDAAQKSGIRIGAPLLSIAQVIRGEKQ